MLHLIKKQVIDLTLCKRQNAFRMQQLASEHYYRSMLSIIETQFTDFATDDEVIRIDRLEIDLGELTEKQLEKATWDYELISRFGQLVKESLQQYSGQQQLIKQSVPAAFCGQWLFYMEKGYLPWNAAKPNKEWKNKVLETLAVDFNAVSALRSLIGQNKNVVTRMVMQHDEVFLLGLTEVLTAEKQTILPAAMNEVYSFFVELSKGGLISSLHLPAKKAFQQTLWCQVLKIAASRDKGLTATELISRILQMHWGLFEKNKRVPAAALAGLQIIPAIIASLMKTSPVSEASQDVATDDNKSNQKYLNENKAAIDKTGGAKSFDTGEEHSGGGQTDLLANGSEPALEEVSRANAVAEKIDEDGVFVVHAGIVLLHPFLNSFFRRIALVKDTVFIGSLAKQKALYLLHYLATGKADAEEHELVLPKLLCEWPLGMPVENELSINTDMYEEAMNLLESVVAQWEILKNSSVSGLREGFLQRPGKIFTRNDNLYLQVESNSIDILLDHLPWNLSIIKLPWMNQILHVEWK